MKQRSEGFPIGVFVTLGTAITLALIGTAEITGFFAYLSYCSAMNQPWHFDTIPVFELPAFAIPAYQSRAQYLLVYLPLFAGLAGVSVMSYLTEHTRLSYTLVKVDLRKQRDGWWYHFWRGLDFSEAHVPIRVFMGFFAALLLLMFSLYSYAAATAFGRTLAEGVKNGTAQAPAWPLPVDHASMSFALTDAARRSISRQNSNFLAANDSGALRLIDDSRGRYLVALEGHPDLPRRIYWLDGSQVVMAEQKFEAPKQSAKHVTAHQDEVSTPWAVVTICALYGFMVGAVISSTLYLIRIVNERRGRRASLRPFAPEDVGDLRLSTTDAFNVFAALRRGLDVSLQILDDNGERNVYLRNSTFGSVDLSFTPISTARPSSEIT